MTIDYISLTVSGDEDVRIKDGYNHVALEITSNRGEIEIVASSIDRLRSVLHKIEDAVSQYDQKRVEIKL